MRLGPNSMCRAVASARERPAGVLRSVVSAASSGSWWISMVLHIDYRLLHASAYFLYVTSLILLAIVFVVGHGQSEWGSQRWIDLKLFPLQPSEVAKPALVLALARYFADHEANARSIRHFVGSFVAERCAVGWCASSCC